MIEGAANNLSGITGITGSPGKTSSAGAAGGASFADILQKSVDEVSKMQQDASQAVNDLATGQTENVTGVMNAVEKSDLAFKTLLAIRAKVMDAYNSVMQIPL
jgi:flagellar hook-basal body complex protein FliE